MDYKWVYSDIYEIGTYRWVLKPWADAIVSSLVFIGALGTIYLLAIVLQ